MVDKVCNGVPGLCEVPISEAHFGGARNHADSDSVNPEIVSELFDRGYRALSLELYYSKTTIESTADLDKTDLYVSGLGQALRLQEVCTQLEDFLSKNPQEVVVLKISHKNHISLQNIFEIFKETGIWERVYRGSGKDISLGELVHKEKQVIVLFDHYLNRTLEDYPFSKSPDLWRDAFSQNYLADNYNVGKGLWGFATPQSAHPISCQNTRGNAKKAWLKALHLTRGEEKPGNLAVRHLNHSNYIKILFKTYCSKDNPMKGTNILFADFTEDPKDSEAIIKWAATENKVTIRKREEKIFFSVVSNEMNNRKNQGKQWLIFFNGLYEYYRRRSQGLPLNE